MCEEQVKMVALAIARAWLINPPKGVDREAYFQARAPLFFNEARAAIKVIEKTS